MNLFFYAEAETAAAEHFEQQLLSRDTLASMTTLPGGSQLNSYHSLKLRSGDVMILFASTNKEVEDLISIHDKFEQFRVILVLPNHNSELVAISHILKPRFITYIDSNIKDIEKVIARIQSQSNG